MRPTFMSNREVITTYLPCAHSTLGYSPKSLEEMYVWEIRCVATRGLESTKRVLCPELTISEMPRRSSSGAGL